MAWCRFLSDKAGKSGGYAADQKYSDQVRKSEKEEKTGNGQQLLKEPMEIVLPMVLTEQDVEKLKIDKSQLVYDENQQVFKLYDRIFEISNAGNLVLPMTGGDGLVLPDILFLAAALLLIGVCLFVYRKGKTTAR